MIDTYQIKRINNKEILYIYLDFNYEIGSFEFNKHIDKIKNIITNFIKESKIAFSGTIVTLVVGGISLGRIYLDRPILKENTITNDIVTEEVLIKKEEIDEIKDDTVEIDNNQTIENKLNGDNNIIIENNNVTTQKENISVNDNQKIEQESNIIETSIPIVEEVIDNNIYITIKRSNGITLDIELEEYVVGVVAAEMPASFDTEALKAQSIIARTYALKAKSKGQILTDSNSTQNYKNNSELQNMWGSSYNAYYNKIKNAVDSTTGKYLTHNGEYIEAVYHSTSNGKTENSINVWGNSFPYLISVDSPYDTINPSFYMEYELTYSELSDKLGMDINVNTEFNILNYTESGRVQTIEINNKIYSGVLFRNNLGLRSNDFEIEKTNHSFIFKTKGYGHGVGMSQYGANGMAKNGYNYIDILLHYYPGVNINQL